MEFNNLMQEVEKMFNTWLNDDTLNEHFNGSVEDLQKDFLLCIQNAIKSDFTLMTKEQLKRELHSYHCSMEGYEE